MAERTASVDITASLAAQLLRLPAGSVITAAEVKDGSLRLLLELGKTPVCVNAAPDVSTVSPGQ